MISQAAILEIKYSQSENCLNLVLNDQPQRKQEIMIHYKLSF